MSKVKWNSSYPFPANSNYANRIMSVDFTPSKASGNPMLVIKQEVVFPQEVESGEDVLVIAGVSTTNYYTTQSGTGENIDTEKTASMRAKLSEMLGNLGIDTSTLDWDNPKPTLEPALKGKIVLTEMGCDEETKRTDPTSAQRAEAKRLGKKPEGTVMKNPRTGQPLVNYWPKVRQVFCLAPDQTAYGPY